jgi:hypothetical protein
MPMNIDWTVNLSHVLTVIGLAVGALAIIYTMRADVRHIEKDLKDIREELKSMAGILVQIAEQRVLINSLERRVTILEDEMHGND